MSEQEIEKNKPMSDDPDVEGHRQKAYGDEAPEGDELGRRETDDDPEVEAHRQKA
jgi:hypothetical protein